MPRRKGVTTKARLNLKLDEDLLDWAKNYAKEHGTNVSTLVRDYFIYLRQQEQDRINAECVSQV
jgi:uncharacterized protein (DUF4415 family)